MSSDPLRVDEIDIRRAPGFERDGLPIDDFSPGINIVHGPNASGKTTLARSTQQLLWPEEGSTHTSLVGQLSLNGESWRVNVDAGRTSYQRDGQDANGPNLPSADHRDRYHLSLHDLLQSETRNETFAQTIKRETAGGFDLDGAHEELGFDDSPSTRGKSVVKDAEAAIEEWREAKKEVEDLREEERRLSALRDELAAARNAKEDVQLYEQAIEYAEARDKLKSARQELEQFPDILSEIDGDEANTVADLEGQIEEWEQKKESAEQERSAAEGELADADLPNEGISTGFIDGLKQLRDDLSSLEDKRRELDRDVADARGQREAALEDIPLDIAESDLADLNPGTWEDISAFARTAEKVQADRAMQQSVETWLESDGEPEAALPDLDRGQQELEQWLANPPADTTGNGNATFRVALASAAIIAVAGIALGLFVHPLLFGILLLAVGIFWYGYRAWAVSDDGNKSRKVHRESFEKLELEQPDEWTESVVRERLTEIYDAKAKYRLADQRKQRRDALENELEALAELEEELEAQRRTLRSTLGAAPESTDIELVVTVKGILRWEEANGQVQGRESKIDAIEEHISEKQAELQSALEQYGYDSVADASEARTHIRNLENRSNQHDDAVAAIERATEAIEEANTKIEELLTERDGIYAEIDLTPADHDELEDHCEQADSYQSAKTAVEEATLLAEKEEGDLEALPGYEPELKERRVVTLEQLKRKAAEQADRYDEIHSQVTEIETKISEAKQASDVEDALAEKERALNELRNQFETDCEEMVGHGLVEHVQESIRQSSRPAVFECAQAILTKITKGRYRLDLDEDEDTFRTFDTINEKGFALDELSSATQLQVLLSVRLAFVEQQEQGLQLPIILDETLANTDDGKAEVIIESMIELAREGRQVFYFTAQGDEVAKWLAALEDATPVDHTVIDLADVRRLDTHVEVPDLDEFTVGAPPPPDPEGHDHDSYGDALDVPPFDPRRCAGHTHLWYLIEDVELLHQLLDLGIKRWGQLSAMLDRGDTAVISDDPEQLEALKCTGQAVEEFVRSWRQGRGKRVDREALEASGAVSSNFIDDVTALATEVNGDAERIIEGLRNGQVNRFRSDKTDDLEVFFEDHGYIEPVETLEPEQIWVRVIDCLVKNGITEEEAKKQGDELLTRLSANNG